MNGKSNASAITLWIAVGVAVFLPQVILIARNWKAFVEAAPQLGAILLSVLELAGGITVAAAVVAVISIGLKRACSQGAEA